MDETDLFKLRMLFEDFKIPYTTRENKEYAGTEFRETTIVIEQGTGYYGFLAGFTFDVDGKFVDYGVWEE